MPVIAMVGFIGSGKDAAAQHLVNQFGYAGMAFADALKDAVAAIFGWDRAMVEGATAESRQWREQVDPWWAAKLGAPHLTPRWVLQNFGTECVRKHFNMDIWIHNVERRILALGPDAKVVITDARFPNELALARSLGGQVVRVQRGPEPAWYATALTVNRPFPQSPTIADLKAANQRRLDKEALRQSVHESEWAWIGQPIDHTIHNDGTLDDLYRAMEAVVKCKTSA